jgi:hypothetical protein
MAKFALVVKSLGYADSEAFMKAHPGVKIPTFMAVGTLFYEYKGDGISPEDSPVMALSEYGEYEGPYIYYPRDCMAPED